VSEPANFPSRLEAIVRAVIEDGKGTIAERAMLNEIDALRAELERTRVSLHVEAAAADAEATFANELNVDVAALRARVSELEGAYRVKPLEWEKKSNGFWADTIIGRFGVGADATGWLYVTAGRLERCDGIEDGKAKAEAHYRERLLVALEPVESPK
jgi:hypothetical protein